MHASHCYDVLNGTTKFFEAGAFKDELLWAKSFIPKLEASSLTSYDRLYPSREIMNLHCEHGSYFLIKCRSKGVDKQIQDFFESPRRRKTVKIFDIKTKKDNELFLIKIANPRLKKDYIYITNLPKELRTKSNIRKLYNMRWEVEVSFKNLAQAQKVEQFHSQFLNGIKQELYAALWLTNATNILAGHKTTIEDEYIKANFKLLYNYITRHIQDFIKGRQEKLKVFFILRDRSREKRKRYSRTYRRVLKHAASPYKYDNSIFIINGVRL